ncbi:MAG: nucleotide exchange factor GrpE [Chloroflexi bacterium]|nr:nucleotide exchange factor GrpE [Chloroflexota bacterium]
MENPDPMETVLEGEPTPPSPSLDSQPAPSAPSEAAAPDPVAELKAQIEAASAKAAEYLDGWQRARADFANYKKRIERENADLSQTVAATVLTRILPALDDFDLAMKTAPADGDGAKWAEGIALVHRKLKAILENEGIQRINADGQPFDPNFHEAVVHEETDSHPEGHVIEVLRQGYKLGDRVIRPALVKVAK